MGAVSGDGNISGILGTFHDRRLLEVFEKDTQFYQLGEKRPLASNDGLTIKFHYFSPQGEGSLLTEGTQPANSFMTTATRTGTIVQFGAVTTISDLLYKSAIADMLEQATIRYGKAAARTIDTYIQDRLYSDETTFASAGHEGPYGTFNAKAYHVSSWYAGIHGGLSAIFLSSSAANGPQVLAVSAVTTANLSSTVAMQAAALNRISDYGMDMRKIRYAVTALEMENVPGFNGPNTPYICVASPRVVQQLREDPEWREWQRYQNVEKMMNGEVGMVENCRIVKSTNAIGNKYTGVGATTTMATGFQMSIATILGQQAFAITEMSGEGMKMYQVPFSAATLDNVLQQNAAIGWKYTGCAKVLQPKAGLGIICVTAI